MTVVGLKPLDDGGLEGHLKWATASELRFRLTFDRSGELVEYAAIADGGPIASRRLRVAPIGEMERAVRAAAVEWGRDGAVRGDPQTVRDIVRKLRKFPLEPVQGRGRQGDQRYAELAALYVDLIERGVAHPVKEMASKLHLGERTVRNLLFKARERGLLTSPGAGKAGGRLTDKAREILDGEH